MPITYVGQAGATLGSYGRLDAYSRRLDAPCTADEAKRHQLKCIFRPMACPNAGCEAGRFRRHPRGSRCASCPDGKYQERRGAANCTECGACAGGAGVGLVDSGGKWLALDLNDSQPDAPLSGLVAEVVTLISQHLL